MMLEKLVKILKKKAKGKKEVRYSLVIVSCLEAAGLIFLSESRVLGQRRRRKGSFSKMWASCL